MPLCYMYNIIMTANNIFLSLSCVWMQRTNGRRNMFTLSQTPAQTAHLKCIQNQTPPVPKPYPLPKPTFLHIKRVILDTSEIWTVWDDI